MYLYRAYHAELQHNLIERLIEFLLTHQTTIQMITKLAGINKSALDTTQRNTLINTSIQWYKKLPWSNKNHTALLCKISPNYDIYTYKRKALRLPANGQRTRSNAKTVRKYGFP